MSCNLLKIGIVRSSSPVEGSSIVGYTTDIHTSLYALDELIDWEDRFAVVKSETSGVLGYLGLPKHIESHHAKTVRD